MMGDTRAVSPAVTQALAIGISTILITGLLVGGTTFINTKTDNTVRAGLQDVGSGVTSDLVRLDQYNGSASTGTIAYTSDYPDRVGGESYRIRLIPRADFTTIFVNSTSSELQTKVRFATETAVCGGTVQSGQLEIVYNTSATPDCLEVREA